MFEPIPGFEVFLYESLVPSFQMKTDSGTHIVKIKLNVFLFILNMYIQK